MWKARWSSPRTNRLCFLGAPKRSQNLSGVDAMQHDYYAFQQEQLKDVLRDLERTVREFEQTKRQKGNNKARKKTKAKTRSRDLVQKVAKIDAHLATLWLQARKVEAEKVERGSKEEVYSHVTSDIQRCWGRALTVEENPWSQQRYDFGKIPDEFKFVPAEADMISLLPFSFLLIVPFCLKKPYLSKDEHSFYLLDNPLRRDKVFRTPMVAPTSWKGALRAAMLRELVSQLQQGKLNQSTFTNKRLQLYRLFGHEKDGTAEFLNRALALHRLGAPSEERRADWEKRFQEEVREIFANWENELRANNYRVGEVQGFQGRLHFYPTFFDQVSLEVINPHDQRTSVSARGPILMECVPANAGMKGVFTLLYVPLILSAQSDADRRREVAEDLVAVSEGVQAMLTCYGFGAKTSSGYGVAEDQLPDDDPGKLLIRCAAISPERFNTLGELVARAREAARQLREDAR